MTRNRKHKVFLIQYRGVVTEVSAATASGAVQRMFRALKRPKPKGLFGGGWEGITFLPNEPAPARAA